MPRCWTSSGGWSTRPWSQLLLALMVALPEPGAPRRMGVPVRPRQARCCWPARDGLLTACRWVGVASSTMGCRACTVRALHGRPQFLHASCSQNSTIPALHASQV